MTILGLNAYHGDSAACLIVDGKLVAAAEEERFRRIKHWAGLPTNAIDYCLREGGISLRDSRRDRRCRWPATDCGSDSHGGAGPARVLAGLDALSR